MSDPASAPVFATRIPTVVRRGVLVALAVALFAIGMNQAGRDAPTVDEGVDLSSGVSLLVRHDARMVPEHPALPRALAAAPALFADPIVPETQAWDDGDWFDWSDDFISANEDAGRLRPMLRWTRSVLLLETIACAALIYLLAKRYFGPDGGFVAAAAWLTTPYVVGIGHFAMIDVPFALATLGLCLVAARWAERPTIGRAVAVGAVLAAALATRHTALVLALFVVGVMAQRLRATPREAARQVAATALVSMLGLWLVYRGLAPTGSSAQVDAQFEGLIATAGDSSIIARIVGWLPLPLEWRAGFAYLDLTSGDRASSLLGQSWDGSRWWFFPVAVTLKLPLTLVAAIVAGWVLAVRRCAYRRGLATFVVLPGLLLWLFLLAQPLNLGPRLALPIVALAFVGLGALSTLWLPRPAPPDRFLARRRSEMSASVPRTGGSVGVASVGVGLVVLVAAVQVVASVVAVPHSLAWTPPPWTPAYQWVSDSGLDAGQALYEVRDWAETHDQPYVAVDSTRGLEVGGGSRSLRGVDPAEVRGWVAVGVTPLMQTRRDELSWLRAYCPVGTLGGGSVLLYRFDGPPDPAPGPERPVGPCFGAEVSARR